MCLVVEKNANVKIAETDIDVFKDFRVKKGFMGHTYTGPYREDYYFPFPDGLYTCEGFDGYTFDNQPDNDYVFNYFYTGVPYTKEWEEEKRKELEKHLLIFVGFHLFKNLQDALKDVVDLKFDHMFAENENEYDVICCTIPKGTKYYEGLFDGEECYCSEQIKLNYN
jgi:hypothetical protein